MQKELNYIENIKVIKTIYFLIIQKRCERKFDVSTIDLKK